MNIIVTVLSTRIKKSNYLFNSTSSWIMVLPILRI